MIIVGQLSGYYGPEEAVEAIDWNVVFLLGGMMDHSRHNDTYRRISAIGLCYSGFQ